MAVVWPCCADVVVDRGRRERRPQEFESFRLACQQSHTRCETAGGMSEEIGYGDMPPKKYTAIHARCPPYEHRAEGIDGLAGCRSGTIEGVSGKIILCCLPN